MPFWCHLKDEEPAPDELQLSKDVKKIRKVKIIVLATPMGLSAQLIVGVITDLNAKTVQHWN